MNTTLWTWTLCAALVGSLERPAIEAQPSPDSPSGSRALVVGVGRYANPAIPSLAGPENDAALVERLLVDHLHFAPENVRVLSTAGGDADQPTRARILTELDALVEARPERAVVYLSGHGSFVPDLDGDEVWDHADEVFLPTDAGTWDDRRGVAENVLLDDEIGAALTRLEDAGAFVWFWTDSCSSGTQDRGTGGEVREVLPAALGVSLRVGPASALDEVEELAPDPAGRRVVFTACRSREKAKSEVAQHPLDPEAGSLDFGVFTRLVAEKIVRSQGVVTYQELIDQVALEAPAAQRPTASGALHHVVLEAAERSYRVRAYDSAWRFTLDVGAADGVQPGAIVRVEVHPGDWVEVAVRDVREATCLLDLDDDWGVPIEEFEETSRPATWGGRALEARLVRDDSRYEVSAGQLAGVELGDSFLAEWGDEKEELQVVELRMDRALAVARAGAEVPEEARAKLVIRPRSRHVAVVPGEVSDELVASARAGVERARLQLADLADADWILELGVDRHILRLGAGPAAPEFWVGTDAEDVLSALARAHRAESLRAMGAESRLNPPEGLFVELCSRDADGLDPERWTPVGGVISPGTLAGLRVRNATTETYTAWMFVIDARHRIVPIEPDEPGLERILPGVTNHRFRTDGLDFVDDPQGPEHVLVIFSEDDRRSSFSWLTQVGLDPVREPVVGALGEAVASLEVPRMRGEEDAVGGYLASFASSTRGLSDRPAGMFAQLVSYEVAWNVPPLARPEGFVVQGEREDAVRELLAGLPRAVSSWSPAAAGDVVWISGSGATCAWVGDGATSALVLDVDGAPGGEWTPDLVLLERGAERTLLELAPSGGAVRRARIDANGDGRCERMLVRMPDGWRAIPVADLPLLSLADLELGDDEWASHRRVRDVLAALAPAPAAGAAATRDASSSFAPGPTTAPGPATAGEAPTRDPAAPITLGTVTELVDELTAALEEEIEGLEIELVDDGEVNARAWRTKEGAKIVVFQGLIDAFRGDVDLLRAVIAHELVHVAEFHSRQRTGAMDLDLHLMRAQETQADLEGAKLLEAAGHPRRDLTLALVELDKYTKTNQVLWHQIVSGDHPSFYARIAALEPASKAAEALASFERGLAFLECRRPESARIAFEEALSLAPRLDEARFNLVRAGLQAYYDELPKALREKWLAPEFGPVLTEVSTVEIRGSADMERYLELVRLANELPVGVRDAQRDFLRGTILVLHPGDESGPLEEGVRILADLRERLEQESGAPGSSLIVTGNPASPAESRLALMPLSTKELRLQAASNMALGLDRLGRRAVAWESLMAVIRPDPPFEPPTSLATNLGRLRPPEVAAPDRELLVAYLQLRYQTANPASPDHGYCKAMLADLAGRESLAGLVEAGPRYAPPTVVRVLGGELELHRAFARDDDRFGEPAQSGPLARQYPGLRHRRWENPDGEGDLVVFTENDRLVQVTSSIPGASLTLTPAEGRSLDPAEVHVGMPADELDKLLGETYRHHPLRNPYPSKGKTAWRGDERWRYYAHLNLGVLVVDDVAAAVTVTAALR